VCRPEHEPWQECDAFSGGDERLCHLAVVDAIGDVRVEARVAAAAVDHLEAGAVGSEVSQQPALPAQVGEADRRVALEPVAARHHDVEGIVEEMLEVQVVLERVADLRIVERDAGNAFSQIETDDPRGTGPPLHLHHNEDETFYVLEGEVTILVGDERIDLAAGDYLFGPREIAHAYVVRSERARMLVTASPAGVEQFFVNLGIPVTGTEPPTDAVMPPMDELVRLFADYGCEILGPPLSLSDLS
jgi:quercetin dioxygenase-like cupin family protein